MRPPPEKFRLTIDKMQAFCDKFKISRNEFLLRFGTSKSIGNNGMFCIPKLGEQTGFYFLALASDGGGWEHVSISIAQEKRCPTWEEMCYIKNIFWSEDEVVVEYHPAKSDYISNHPYCLHLWKPIGIALPVPPSEMVGFKKFNR